MWPIFLQANFIQKSNFRFSWMNYGCTYNRFNFKLFSVPNSGNYAALLLPFDVFTWFSIFICAIAVNGLLFLILFTRDRIHNQTMSILFWTVTTLLDQSNKIHFHSQNNKPPDYLPTRGPPLVLLGSWLISAYFLGNLYKGAMYSCLTSLILPTVPTNLQGLVLGSDIPIMTTSSHRQNGANGSRIVSTLHELVIPQLINVLDKNYSLYNVLQRIKNTSAFFRDLPRYEVARNVSEGQFLNSSTGKSMMIPDNFAILDADADLIPLTSAIRLFPKYLPIVNNEADSFYTVLTPWIIMRNFFDPIFIGGIARLVESGMYQRWGESNRDINLLLEIQRFKGVNNISTEFAKVVFAREMRSSYFSSGESVPFHKLRVPVVICLFFAGLGLISFFIECITRKVKFSVKVVDYDNNFLDSNFSGYGKPKRW